MVHIINSISCGDLISSYGVRKDFLVEEIQLVPSLIMGILLPRLGLCAIANARPSEGGEIRIILQAEHVLDNPTAVNKVGHS